MYALLSLTGDITSTITQVVGNLGYLGIFILMTIESAGIPIPSEIIMTYAGFMATPGGIPHVVLVAVIGSMGTGLGSAIGYCIGARGGKPFVDRYGKYLGINAHKMMQAERWFCKYGEAAVIFTRMLPVVRTIVNIPAGLLNMDFKKFMLYSMMGAFPWCMVLATCGYLVGENWESIIQASHMLTYAVLGIIGVIVILAVVLYALMKVGIIERKTLEKYLGFILHA
jgi:membrane protein DedA with SNARE-associated domain